MNYRRIFKKLTVAFAVCLVGSMPVYGAGVSDDGLLNDAAWEVSAESDAVETDNVSEEELAETDAEVVSGEDPEQVETDAQCVSKEDLEGPAAFDMSMIPEELTGAYWYYFLETGTQYDFKCSNITDYNCYMFTPEEAGTYRVDVIKTTGRVYGTVYTSEDAVSMHETDAWTEYYDESGYHITIRMKANLKYVFCIYPDSDRADRGKFRINKTTKDVASAAAVLKSGRFLTVGNFEDGAWHVNDDGSINYNVWDFKPERLLDLFTVKIKFTDGSSFEWSYSDKGAYVGSTYYMMRVTQDTDNWVVGEVAYCDLWFCDEVGELRVAIPYLFFTDVQDPTNPYYNAIYWAASNGITKGYSDNTFGIDRTCTRGEAVMFLWRLMGKPEPKAQSKSPFTDVSKTHAFYKAILWASQKGITKGFSDGTFGIDKTCTRGQIMMFIWRAKGMPAPKTVTKSPFTDVPKTHVFYKAILWGSQKRVTKGFADGTFGVDKNCTRGQIVTFLYRIK